MVGRRHESVDRSNGRLLKSIELLYGKYEMYGGVEGKKGESHPPWRR
jgi:hypothetical protein